MEFLLFMMVSAVHAQQKDSGGKNSKGADVDALHSQPQGCANLFSASLNY
jgi:hypothetical protein